MVVFKLILDVNKNRKFCEPQFHILELTLDILDQWCTAKKKVSGNFSGSYLRKFFEGAIAFFKGSLFKKTFWKPCIRIYPNFPTRNTLYFSYL